MKVITNTPAPVTPPPTTYDLVGLTRDEMVLLRHVLGETTSDTDVEARVPRLTGFRLYTAVNEALTLL